MLIRPIEKRDLGGLIQVSKATGMGMTSIPKDKASLENILDDALQQKSYYLFVLEDTENQKIGGICGIMSQTGVEEPVCFYKLEVEHRGERQFQVLHPVCHSKGPSEICSLYLRSEYRQGGLGKLLSLSRFHFIAANKERFSDILYAELRGYVDKQNTSPFWDGLGRRFFGLSFEEVNAKLNGRKNSFVESMPRYPIYVWMLGNSCRSSIGKTHPNTRKALRMLEDQGFTRTNLVNTIDAGPIVEAEVNQIRTIRESSLVSVAEIKREVTGKKALLSNNKLAFRACFGKCKHNQKGLVISEQTAKALLVEKGDQVRLSSI